MVLNIKFSSDLGNKCEQENKCLLTTGLIFDYVNGEPYIHVENLFIMSYSFA